jgi:TetR/AcrR family transcriptional regulator, cholesterol catabolism regulator
MEQILEKVGKLYSCYGIKSVTMDDVAKHLCISKKTLYEHFKDKEDLVRAILFLEHNIHVRISGEISTKNLNAIEELMDVYRLIHKKFNAYNPSMEYDIRKYYPDLYKSIRDTRRKTMFDSFLKNLKKGKKEGLFRKEINAGIIARLHVFLFENLYDNDLFTLEELTTLNFFQELFIYHLHGILSNKGLLFLQKNSKKIGSAFL